MRFWPWFQRPDALNDRRVELLRRFNQRCHEARAATLTDLDSVVKSAERKGSYEGGLWIILEAYRDERADLRAAVRSGLLAAGFVAEGEL